LVYVVANVLNMPSALTRVSNKTISVHSTHECTTELKSKLIVIDRKHWTAMNRSIILQFVMVDLIMNH
jgi:hypothetical protein